MTAAYVDTSYLVAIVYGEPGWEECASRLQSFDILLSSNLLEAELGSALEREEVTDAPTILDGLTWILPDRRLTPEIDRVLAVARLRGADLWHVACALYVAESPADLGFLSLDERQREAAVAIGFGLA